MGQKYKCPSIHMKGGHYMSVKAIESHLFPPLVSAEVISADGSEIITGSGPVYNCLWILSCSDDMKPITTSDFAM